MNLVKFITLGCKANQYDTQNIRERLLDAGLKDAQDRRKADIYIINTCTVTHKADRDSLYHINRAHRQNPKAKIIVTGCLAELDGADISRQPGVHLIVKNKNKNRIPELLNELNAQTRKRINAQTYITNKGISYFEGHTRAFLKIQDGCNNFCSYCKVPLVRGKSRSKPLGEIIKEAKCLVENGYKEIVLTGICLGSYGRDLKTRRDLVDIIDAIEGIDGLLRVRLSSIEAADISDRLIRKMSCSKKLCRHLHIPIQSGDDKILKKMNRGYSSKSYSRLFRKIKSAVPEIAITTDVLVGFPGEKERNFLHTAGLLKEILPLRVHIFPYSPREYTPAYNFPDKIKPETVRERISKLKETAQECAYIYRKKFLGKKIEALIEDKVQENPLLWEGYTDNYIRVCVKSDRNLKNQVVSLRLKKIKKDCTEADLL